MSTYVALETSRGRLAVELAHVRAVLEPHGIVPLPEPRPGLLGLLRPDRDALPVLGTFDAAGAHVLVVEHGGVRYGVLVERVVGVVRATEALRPAPLGPDDPLLRGLVPVADGNLLLIDVPALTARVS